MLTHRFLFCRSAHVVLSGLLATVALSAQGVLGHPSSIRCWGKYVSDTEAREGRFVRLAAGNDATAALRSDGRLFINGQNYYGNCIVPPPPSGLHYVDVAIDIAGLGLLSDGTIQTWGGAPSFPLTAPSLPPGIEYKRVATRGSHALALRSDGVLVAWGRNLEGQCSVPPLPAGNAWAEVTAGNRCSLARLADGSILAWGDPTTGQTNVPALPLGAAYVSVYAGERHAVAVRSDGAVVAWGDNTEGQCNVPPLPAGTSYLLAAAGDSHSQAVRSDGVVVSWGNQTLGQGNAPIIPAGVKVLQLACGIHHAAMLLSNGEVLAWGHNAWQQAHIPRLPTTPRPVRFTGVSVGYGHVLGMTSDAGVLGWGDAFASVAQQPASLQGTRWRHLEAAYSHNLGVDVRGRMFAWGSNTLGQLNVPALPAGLTYTDSFSASPYHCVAIRSDGSAVVFGTTYFGEGVIPPLPAGIRYVDVDTEYARTVLLRSDGEVVCLGDSASGQNLVVPLPASVRYADVAVSRWCTAGLRSDGLVEMWGSTASSVFTPLAPLPTGVVYVEVEGAYGFFVLRRSDGQVVTCGHMPLHQDVIPPLDPGTSYVEVSAGGEIATARVGPTCTYVSLAPGCPGSLPASRLIPRDTPRIGKTLEVTLFDLPQHIAFLVFGWQMVPGVDLGFLGMPGCNLHVSLDAIVPLVGTNTQAKWLLPIPNDPIWVGARFYNQALVFDPAVGNGFDAVVSDAAEAVIGHW